MLGVDDQTWNVWVGVNEATPPMEVLDLPAAGQPIILAKGATKDFRIRIGEKDAARWREHGRQCLSLYRTGQRVERVERNETGWVCRT